MNATIASEFPTLARGQLTFAGLLQHYFYESDASGRNIGISAKWDEEKTAGRCLNDYERRILPTMERLGLRDVPASELKEEDYESILNKLAEQYHYNDGTIAHYRLLISRVYHAGVDHDHFPDHLLWLGICDSDTETEADKESHRVNSMTKIRKSFSISEELRLVRWILSLSPITATGEEIGLMLMYTTALRGNETCGANFSSVHILDYHEDTPVIDMLQSTKKNSSETKSGGKTSNAPRTLLLMIFVYDFIQKRKEYIASLINSGKLELGESYGSVEDLPIVCRKHNYLQRASSGDLSAAGKALFLEIGIEKSELSYLFEVLCSSEFQSMQIEEKDPTTYLFRRNFATHLYQLGFTPSEIQYWMGHEIEDPFTQRSFYADPDQIYGLKAKWEQHPVLRILQEMSSKKTSEVICTELPVRTKNVEQMRLQCPLATRHSVFMSFESQEPQSALELSIDSDAKSYTVDLHCFPRENSYPRQATITDEVFKAYTSHMEIL